MLRVAPVLLMIAGASATPAIAQTSAQRREMAAAADAADQAARQIDAEIKRTNRADARKKPRQTIGRYPQKSPELQRQWEVMNEECRGGQHTPNDAICTARDNIGVELERRGICWSYSDWRVYPTDYRWHPCSQPHPSGWRPD